MKPPAKIVFFLSISLLAFPCFAQDNFEVSFKSKNDLNAGAEQTTEYLPLLKNKTVAVVANQTSFIKNTHLVDSLISLKVRIKCVLAPEHGFRGNASAGQHVVSQVDEKTGLFVVSLYGKHMKPTAEDLHQVDVVLFDIQDVGVRFYTYISTLQYVMEACAEQNKELIILDRPNPNGFYIDGPVLEKKFSSFIGMNAIPIVYGMTIGEYALMLNGEHWLKDTLTCRLKVIKVKNYSHKDFYQLPVRPSPNLPNMSSVYLYPSLCLFEGTKVSLGRGTDKPFQVVGYPGYKEGNLTFTPENLPGIAEHPPYQDTLCSGYDLSEFGKMCVLYFKKINLMWLKGMYDSYPDKEKFFTGFFENLAGTDQLRQQIIKGLSEDEIRMSWKPGLDGFRQIRKKYLLYEDFE
jgi:uncharacterized protein YbbC (DUF1343 family)